MHSRLSEPFKERNKKEAGEGRGERVGGKSKGIKRKDEIFFGIFERQRMRRIFRHFRDNPDFFFFLGLRDEEKRKKGETRKEEGEGRGGYSKNS